MPCYQYIDHLFPCTGFMYIDQALLDVAGGYGFCGEEWDTESTSELANDLNDDEVIHVQTAIYDQDSYEPISMDFSDPLLLPNNSGSSMTTLTSGFPTSRPVPGVTPKVQDTLRRGLEDPKLRQEMLKLIQKKGRETRNLMACLCHSHVCVHKCHCRHCCS